MRGLLRRDDAVIVGKSGVSTAKLIAETPINVVVCH